MKEIICGLWKNHPIFRQLLGMCPTLAVTTSALNGLSMGLAVIFVLVFSCLTVSLIKKISIKKIIILMKLMNKKINIRKICPLINKIYKNKKKLIKVKKMLQWQSKTYYLQKYYLNKK